MWNNVIREALIKAASSLMGDCEADENPEYLRGMVELIMEATGMRQESMDDLRLQVEAAIMQYYEPVERGATDEGIQFSYLNGFDAGISHSEFVHNGYDVSPITRLSDGRMMFIVRDL